MDDDAGRDIFEEVTAMVISLLPDIIAEDLGNVVSLAFPTE